jgi:hypothetical protein
MQGMTLGGSGLASSEMSPVMPHLAPRSHSQIPHHPHDKRHAAPRGLMQHYYGGFAPQALQLATSDNRLVSYRST